MTTAYDTAATASGFLSSFRSFLNVGGNGGINVRHFDLLTRHIGAGTIADAKTIHVRAPTGSITTHYALYIEDASAPTNSYGVYQLGTGMLNLFQGKLGLGTGAIPHGGVGYAKLAVDGANAHADGPHVQFTTFLDDHPVLQMLNWTHDNISLNFDAYWAAAWLSSSASNNFQITKNAGALNFKYSGAVAAGGAITWSNGIVMDGGGRVGMGAVPTSGVPGALLQLFSSLVSGAGARYVALNDVGAAPQTIIASGVTWARFEYVGVHSGGATTSGTQVPGGAASFSGGHLFTFALSGGALTVSRTSGSGTADFSIWIIYL
jgi:hypothetical protein